MGKTPNMKRHSCFICFLVASSVYGGIAFADHNAVMTTIQKTAKALGNIRHETLPNLIKLLDDPNERVRAAAIEAIIRVDITNPIAQPGLLNAMRDPSIRVQYAANKALVELGPVNIDVIRALIQAIRDNAKSFNDTRDYKGSEYNIVPVSEDIIRRLDTQNHYAAPDFIALAKDQNPGVQRIAIIALTNIDAVPKEFIPMLMKNVRTSASVWAVNALVCLGPEAETEVPALLEMLRDKQPGIRDAAARILAVISCPANESATPSMEEYIKKTGTIPKNNLWADLLIPDSDSTTADDQPGKNIVFIQHKLSRTTIRLAKATARAEQNARKKSGPGLRYRRPPGMENIDSDEAIAQVIKTCMHDFEDDSKVTYETAQSRIHYLGDRAFDALTQGLISENYNVRNISADEIRQRGIKGVTFLRKAVLKEPIANRGIVEYKKYRNWPSELMHIYQLTLDAETLAGEQFGDAEIKQLIQQITSDNPYVSEGCILALGELRAESAVPAITSLSPKKPGVCFALAKIASRDAITFLLNAIQSSDKEDCNAAVYTRQYMPCSNTQAGGRSLSLSKCLMIRAFSKKHWAATICSGTTTLTHTVL